MTDATVPGVARIYTLSDPRTLEVRYVGMTTKSLRMRLRGHRSNSREKNHRAYWIHSLLSIGLEPLMTEVEVVLVDQRATAEQRWIAYYRAHGARLVNATDGGEGTVGHKMSAATRKKISDIKKATPQWHLLNYVRSPVSEETKERIRQATMRQFKDPAQREAVSRVHKGKTISPEHRRIVSEANRQRWAEWRASGGAVSEETRQRIRDAAKGRPGHLNSPEVRAKRSEAKRQWWAEKKADGSYTEIQRRMRETRAKRSGTLSGLGTVTIDDNGFAHGTTGYGYGCRCEICGSAREEAGRRRTAKNREAYLKRPPRFCEDCGTDISDRRLDLKRCQGCSTRRHKESARDCKRRRKERNAGSQA